MATRILTLDTVVAPAGYSLPRNSVVTLTDDAAATALIAAGRAVAVADATTNASHYATDRWVLTKVGTGAI